MALLEELEALGNWQLSWLDSVDRGITLALNFDGGPFADLFFSVLSSRLVWIPWALLFLYKLKKKDGMSWRGVTVVVVCLAVAVGVCDSVSASVFKPFFMRLRPSHNPEVEGLLHYVNDYRGGLYGFVSSHAANAFGAAAFVSRLSRSKRFAVAVCLFALMVSYSRVYLGVHYVGDILGGSVFGIAVGLAFSWFLRIVMVAGQTKFRLGMMVGRLFR